MRNYLFFFLFFSVKTKHAAYLVYAVHVTLVGEETDEQKMPALLTAHIQADITKSASTPSSFTGLFAALLFFPVFFKIIYFIVKDTQKWQRPLAVTKLYVHVIKNWPLVPLYVCLVTDGKTK